MEMLSKAVCVSDTVPTYQYHYMRLSDRHNWQDQTDLRVRNQNNQTCR